MLLALSLFGEHVFALLGIRISEHSLYSHYRLWDFTLRFGAVNGCTYRCSGGGRDGRRRVSTDRSRPCIRVLMESGFLYRVMTGALVDCQSRS